MMRAVAGLGKHPTPLYEAYSSGLSLKDLHRAAMDGAFQPHPLPDIGLPPPQ